MLAKSEILQILSHLPFQVEGSSFEMEGEMLCFLLTFNTGNETTHFKVKMTPWYPFHFMGQEGISFFNEDLKEFAHIMEHGNLCIHSLTNQDPKSKFREDVTQLYDWIVKYLIHGAKDSHYEDIVVNDSLIGECYMCYAVPLSERPNLCNDYGVACIKNLSPSILHETKCLNHLVYCFHNIYPKADADNFWLSSVYKTYDHNDSIAPFVLLKDHPSRYGKFAIKDIGTLSSFMTQAQLQFISHMLNDETAKDKQFMPIFIGFPTVNNQIGWLTLMINLDNIPWHGEAERINGVKTGKWLSVPNKNAEAVYAKTEIITPELYYGRGMFPESFTLSKILILGVGAIGSILAKTLVKCGCRNISLYDFDTKSYGNCCRSEYDFYRGNGDKQNELCLQLTASDPFVEITLLPHNFDLAVKAAFNNGDHEMLNNRFNEYDYIFDCTTDDDLTYILDQLQVKSQVVNLSISNHAKQLVCGFSPKISDFLKLAFSKLVKADEHDLYNPTGCWNPTFKASYNDINLMLQYALKRIVRMVTAQEIKHNFILSDSDEGLRIERI